MSIRLATITTLTAVLFGPPSIKVEAVTNPTTAPVPGAVFMITARHHLSTEGVEVTGRAEGVVAGKRVSRALTLAPTASAGVYGVTRQWEAGQPWVLVFAVSSKAHEPGGVAEAVVRLSAAGQVMGIAYPMGKLDSGYPWPRRATAHEVDSALAGLVKSNP